MRVNYKGTNVYTCCEITLLPGENRLDDAQVKKLKEHPLFKKRIEEQIIEIIPDEKPKKK